MIAESVSSFGALIEFVAGARVRRFEFIGSVPLRPVPCRSVVSVVQKVRQSVGSMNRVDFVSCVIGGFWQISICIELCSMRAAFRSECAERRAPRDTQTARATVSRVKSQLLRRGSHLSGALGAGERSTSGERAARNLSAGSRFGSGLQRQLCLRPRLRLRTKL